MKEIILETIYDSIDELNEQLSNEKQLTKSTKTVLFGNSGQLDSLGLVKLLIIIEQNIADNLDKSITIADERAISQKHSPFKTIGTLANYIDMRLNEN